MTDIQRMLCYKAWLETRSRFFTALVATVAVCAFWTLGHTWIDNQWQRDLIEHPEWKNPAWFLRAMDDYPFYLHHFVYAEMLQKIWVIFAVLLGIGGLTREAAQGTAGFTLSLPVSRLSVFRAHAVLALVELFALCLAAPLLIVVLSRVMHLDYPLGHGLSHSALIFFGGIVFLAASLCVTQFVEGEHTPALIGLGGVGLLYFVMQPYVDGLPVSGLAVPFALPKLMAGNPDIRGVADIDWWGMTASLMAATGFFALAVRRNQRHDY
ncbi:MAG: ABC transporter permease subunit [Gemmatimonadaceae bacterium]|nr:ABC transporter permease subunit [Gemmatimonadaceae bacterium]